MALYNIVVPNLRHFSVFAPKIVSFEEQNGIYNTREVSLLQEFPHRRIFFEKSFRVPKNGNVCRL
jgi:hypothetical protein